MSDCDSNLNLDDLKLGQGGNEDLRVTNEINEAELLTQLPNFKQSTSAVQDAKVDDASTEKHETSSNAMEF